MIESKILGAILNDPECMNDVADFLQPEWFSPPYDKVYNTISKLYAENTPIDTVSVYEQSIKDKSDIQPIFLSELTSSISSSANVEYHSRVLYEKWRKKETLKVLDNSKTQLEANEDVFEVTENHVQKMMDLSEMKNDRGEEVSRVVLRVVDHIDKMHSGDSSGMWVDSGFYDLDDKFKFGNSDLIYIAARPSMGKTALMTSLGKNMCVDGYVGVFSLEMSSEQLTTRLISGESGFPYLQIIGGGLKDEDGASVARAAQKVSNMKMFIDDTGGLSPMALTTKARRMKKKYDIRALFIDYIQLMRYMPLIKDKNNEVSYISARLKELAKDLNIPVISLAQLNRGVESRSDKRPTLADLRDSGSLEQDADSVIMLYRPEYYGELTLENGNDSTGVCQLLIRKQRNGAVGEVNLKFDKETTTFKNLDVRF